jgi:hypothetical protein
MRNWLESFILMFYLYFRSATRTLASGRQRFGGVLSERAGTIVFWAAGAVGFIAVIASILFLKGPPLVLACTILVVLALAIGLPGLLAKLGMEGDDIVFERSKRNAFKSGIVLAVTLGVYFALSHVTYKIIATAALVLGMALVFWLTPSPFIVISLPVILLVLSVVLGMVAAVSMSGAGYYASPLPRFKTALVMRSEQPSVVSIEQSLERLRAQANTIGTGFDLFQDRISDPIAIEGIIEGLRQAYSFSAEDVAFQEFAGHLRSLYSEIVAESITKELVAVGMTALTAGFVGYLLAERMLDRMKAKLGKTYDPRISPIMDELQLLVTFFKHVSQSRFAEIVATTRLPEDRVRILLKAGPFTHEKACFWRFADRTDVEQIKARERYKQAAAFSDFFSSYPRPEPPTPFDWLGRQFPTANGSSVSMLDPVRLIKLRGNLTTHFNREEFRDLCFDLNISYENLPDRLDGMAREVVVYCARAGLMRELVAECRKLRPNFDWEDVSE